MIDIAGSPEGNGRVYLYCSHDQDNATSFWSMDNYYLYSSTDLVHWTDHGEVLNSSQLPNQWAGVGGLWAPDCAYRNGKYYFYFPCMNGTGGTGVATSLNPEGPFVDALGHRMTGGEIDPCIFKDDDGEYYFIQGGLQGATTIARLNPDMISLAEPKRTINNGSGSNWEGNWMYKRNGIYYLHGANGGGNYSMGSSPYGPFTYKGKLIDGFDHPGILEYKGQWYYFSQITNYTDANGISGADVRRNITIEYMYFNADGTIKPIARTTEGVSISDSTPPGAPTGLSLSAINEHKVSIHWNASSDLETGISNYYVYRGASKVGTTNTTTAYIDSGLTGNTAYTYQISAGNGAGMEGPKSESKSITMPADNVPPKIVNVNAASRILVIFSEVVEQTSAENIANYTITSASGASIPVSAAQLQADLKSVILTAAILTQGAGYTLTVNNVQDRAIPPNKIAPNSTATFVCVNTVTKIRFYPRAGLAARMTGGIFEGSNGDPVNGPYSQLYQIGATPPDNQWSEATNPTNSTIGYRYVRYRSTGSSNVAEIELYLGAQKASGVPFGSPGSWANSGNDFRKAFDGDISTFFDYSADVGGYAGLDLMGGATIQRKMPSRAAEHQAPQCRTIGRRIFLRSAATLTVTNARGAVVLRRRTNDAATVSIDDLRPGAYAVQVDRLTGRTVDRLVVGGR